MLLIWLEVWQFLSTWWIDKRADRIGVWRCHSGCSTKPALWRPPLADHAQADYLKFANDAECNFCASVSFKDIYIFGQ